MLNYHITTEAEKKLIAGWAYPRDYAIYDLPSYETQKKRGFGLTNPQNHFYSFYDGAELIGFMSLREEANVYSAGRCAAVPWRCRPAGAVRLSDFGLGRAAAGTGTLQQTRRVELLRGNRHSGHTSRP